MKQQQPNDSLQRSVLLIRDGRAITLTTYDAKDPDEIPDIAGRPSVVHGKTQLLFPRDNEFTGKINWVQIDIDAAAQDVDHKLGAEERFMIAMARQ
jgi:hypothetical protein